MVSTNSVANFCNLNSMRGACQPWHLDELRQTAELWQKFGGAFNGAPEDQVSKLLCDIQNFSAPSEEHTEGPGVIDLFCELAGYASRDTRLTLDVSESGEVGLAINQGEIARLQLTKEQRNTLLQLNGVSRRGAVTLDVSPLKQHEIPVQLDGLTNDDFKRGGKHKNFYRGVLCAEKKVAGEFEKEGLVKDLATKQAGLQRYVSTQQRVDADDVPEVLNSDRVYATVTMYNPAKVYSCEMDELIAGRALTPGQLRGLARQFTEMLKQFYLAGLTHGDLHMHNLVVRWIPGEDGRADQTLLQAIDFGKSKCKRSRDDIQYAFERKAEHALETIKRNVLRSEGNLAQQKHYPLHKLLGQWAGDRFQDSAARDRYVTQPLAQIGRALDKALKAAGGDEDRIGQAFDDAAQAVDTLFDRVASLPVPRQDRWPVSIEMVPLN